MTSSRIMAAVTAGIAGVNGYADKALELGGTAGGTDTAVKFYRCTQVNEGGNYGALMVIILILIGWIALSKYKDKRK